MARKPKYGNYTVKQLAMLSGVSESVMKRCLRIKKFDLSHGTDFTSEIKEGTLSQKEAIRLMKIITERPKDEYEFDLSGVEGNCNPCEFSIVRYR